MSFGLIVSAAALIFGLSMPAPDLKPVKDKDTRLFGYQNPSKEWVISPSFDKAGKFDQGDYVFEPQFTNIQSFDKDGLSATR